MRYLPRLVYAFLILACHPALAQDELFHEIVLEKQLLENEKWEFLGEANWKRVYDEVAWRRWGLSAVGVRKIGRLNLSAGLNGYYTFNRQITNFFELRPWLAAAYKIPLSERTALRQRLKYERRFFFEADDPARENYGRLRYQIDLDITISKEKEAAWKIRPFFEWYFIRDPATFERFPNERDYGLRLIKRFENEHEAFLGYKMEAFYTTAFQTRGQGHIFSVGYAF